MRKDIKPLPSKEFLESILNYDPATGALTWKVNTGPVKAGNAAGCVDRNGYLIVKIKGSPFLAHRLIHKMVTGNDPTEFIDHKNRSKSDNTWDNLREATNSQNCLNSTINRKSKSGIKCVYYEERSKLWYVRMTYKTKEEAVAAFELLHKERDGEFAATAN